MAKQSAGLMMYRRVNNTPEVFLVHPGGPYWSKKDEGAWSIPKGEYLEDEDPLEAARREFTEETGFPAEGHYQKLGSMKQTGGKEVTAWAFEGDCEPQLLASNSCQIEWPPRSSRFMDIPEVDKGAWFTLIDAEKHIMKSQAPFLQRLREVLLNAAAKRE